MNTSPVISEQIVSPVRGRAYNSTLGVLATISPDRARLFMAQWYAFSASIPAFLSLCAWRAGSELERRNIIINLHSELGLDGNEGTHPELLADLIVQATGEGPSLGDITDGTRAFILAMSDSVMRGSPAFNSGVLLGLEHVAYDILSVLKEILTKAGCPHLVGHRYITLHEEIEAMHIESTEENVSQYPDDQAAVSAGFEYVMSLWEGFWTSAYSTLVH